MIDTLKFGIPLTQSQLTKLQKFLAGDDRWQWVQFQNSTGEIRFTRCRGLVHIEQHSYHREIFWDIPHSYIPDQTFLTLELSLPKFWYGHNIHLLYDFVGALKILKKLLETQLHCRFPDVMTWQVWRADICYAWRCPSQNVAQQLLNSLKRLHFPYKKPIIYHDTILFAGATYSVKFYLKYNEFLKNDRKALLKDNASLEWINHLEQKALGVLRYEVTLRRKFLKRDLIETVGDLSKVIKGVEWSKEFLELNDHYSKDKPETVYGAMLSTIGHTLVEKGMTWEEVSFLMASDEGFSMNDGDVYYAPPQTIEVFGEQYIHKGGGFTFREKDKITLSLQYFLEKFLGKNRTMEEADEVKLKLYKMYKTAKAFRLYATWLAVQRHGSCQVKQDIGDRSYYRIKSDLKKAGCSFIEPPVITWLDDNFYKQFSFNVPSSHVTNQYDDFRDCDNVFNLMPYLTDRLEG
jgi:Phage replication protein CRI